MYRIFTAKTFNLISIHDHNNKLPYYTNMPEPVTTRLIKKVYIYDTCNDTQKVITQFCEKHGFDAHFLSDDEMLDLLANPSEAYPDMLAFFIGPTETTLGLATHDIADRIFNIRHNIALMIRTPASGPKRKDALEWAIIEHNHFVTIYSLRELDQLDKALESKIYSAHFPNTLISAIQSLGTEALSQSIKEIKVTPKPAYLVVDQLVRGPMVSAINLYSSWCQGHLMVTCDEADIINIIADCKTTFNTNCNRTVEAKDILAELSNLIWGNFRRQLYTEDDYAPANVGLQIPCVIDHNSKTIRFSSRIPQLCFRYLIEDTRDNMASFYIEIKLIFNMFWDQEKFEKSITERNRENTGDNDNPQTIEYL